MTGWAGAALVLVGSAWALGNGYQSGVTPPAGSTPVLEVSADGVQIYACEAKGETFDWVFKSPEASLQDKSGRQVGTHFAGPSWKLSDGSAVTGEVVGRADAPDVSAIPWLLLHARSHEGSGTLSTVAYIRRSNTKGGVAPTTGCDASHVSQQIRVHYSAIYQFFSVSPSQ